MGSKFRAKDGVPVIAGSLCESTGVSKAEGQGWCSKGKWMVSAMEMGDEVRCAPGCAGGRAAGREWRGGVWR